MRPNIELVKKLTSEKQWSMRKLSIVMGVSHTEVHRLFSGERVGGRKAIAGLMKAFPDVPLERLFILDNAEPINSERR